MIKHIIVLFIAVLFLSSCNSNKRIVYFSNNKIAADSTALKYETVLQPDDILLITVTSVDAELANNFNLMYLNAQSTESRTTANEDLFSYLIDQQGEIDFPVLGKIKLAGLTRIEAELKIKELLRTKGSLKNAGVNLRLLNFKFSVTGEVRNPGTYPVRGDRITVLEAVSMAGDLTIYGKRKDITIIREIDGVRTMNTVDITDASIITSPYYYLAHNDVIYVKPNKTRVNSSVVGPNITVGISAISLLITIITLSLR